MEGLEHVSEMFQMNFQNQWYLLDHINISSYYETLFILRFKEFILCLGYKGEVIKDFLNYKSRVNDFTLSFNKSDEITYHSSFMMMNGKFH